MEWFYFIYVFVSLVLLNVMVESDSKSSRAISAAIICGLLLGCIIIYAATDTASGLINECEKDLPRSEKCVLIAVPEYTVGE